MLKDLHERPVWLVEEACTGRFWHEVTSALAPSKPDGTRTIFFKFEDAAWDPDYLGQTEPSVKWIAHDHLEVSIGAVARVLQKMDRVDGIRVTYDIGNVLRK